MLLLGFLVAHSGHVSSQFSRSSALEFLIFWFSFLFTSHTPTTHKCSGIFFSADFTHHHPLPKSKLSTTLARMYLTALNTLHSSSPHKPTFVPYYLPISSLDSAVDLTTLFYIFTVQLLVLYYKYLHLKFSTLARKLC